MSRYKETMTDILFSMREGYSPKEIKMAIGIASDPRYKGGDYTGAVNAIEKIKKGLSNHKQVAAVLKRQNEDVQESGHDDVKSAKNQVQIAMSALEKMNAELGKLKDEDSLPTWWTNKVAVAVDKLDGMADYLDTQVEEVELDEAVKYQFVAIDRLGKVIGFASDERDAKDMARRGHTMDSPSKGKGIAGRNKAKVVKLKKPMSDKQGDMMINRDFDMNKFGGETTYSIGLKKEEVELDEMKEPFAVVDTADGDKVVGTASSEKGAKEIISTAQLPPMKIKDKKTLKIVKTRKKQMIGYPLAEELEENVFKELQIAAKDLAKYASKDKKGMDYKDFMKAAAMMKTGKVDQLVKHTNDLDTEPRDVIIMAVKDAIGKQAAERLFKVSIS